jgi:hypothetical protein
LIFLPGPERLPLSGDGRVAELLAGLLSLGHYSSFAGSADVIKLRKINRAFIVAEAMAKDYRLPGHPSQIQNLPEISFDRY